MPKTITERVARVPGSALSGTFYRHAAPGRDAFAGSLLGRWGRTFPVVYLGRPPESVTVEAYRHLVEPHDIPPSAVKPRVLYTVEVAPQKVLDLTKPDYLAAVGLTPADLTTTVDDYDACQEVARAAHQLEFHGVLAPAATGLGDTLALFVQRIGADEQPVVVDQTVWTSLPADPRTLRAVRRAGDSA